MVIWRINKCRLLLQVIYEALHEGKKAWVRTKTQFFGEVAKYAYQWNNYLKPRHFQRILKVHPLIFSGLLILVL